MNFSEKEIQDKIYSKGYEWHELISELNLPIKTDFIGEENSIEKLTVNSLLTNRIIEKLNYLYTKLIESDLIGNEVSLYKEGDSTIRADLIGRIPAGNHLMLIEVKKSYQTERESFTELLGYSNHLNTVFPTLNKTDIFYILIAPFENRIVRDAFIKKLVFDNINIIGLIPFFEDSNDINTLKLKPFIPDFKDLIKFTDSAFNEKNFNVVKVTWTGKEHVWNMPNKEDPNHHIQERMNLVCQIVSQKMESNGIHGFVFTSQLWPEFPFMCPNSLIMVGLNPYSINHDLYFSKLGVSKDDLKFFDSTAPSFSEAISLFSKDKLSKIDEKDGLMEEIRIGWDSILYKIGFEALDIALKDVEETHFIKDRGSFTWDDYQTKFIEDVTCFNFKIFPTGLINELYLETLGIDYKFIQKHGIENHFFYGDIEGNLIDSYGSHMSFRLFIKRMFNNIDDFI